MLFNWIINYEKNLFNIFVYFDFIMRWICICASIEFIENE